MQFGLKYTIERPKVTDADVRDPIKLRDRLDKAYEEITALHKKNDELQQRIVAVQNRTLQQTQLTPEQVGAINRTVREGVAGFLMIPVVNNPPAGLPNTASGGAPAAFCSSDNKLYVHVGEGSWLSAAFT